MTAHGKQLSLLEAAEQASIYAAYTAPQRQNGTLDDEGWLEVREQLDDAITRHKLDAAGPPAALGILRILLADILAARSTWGDRIIGGEVEITAKVDAEIIDAALELLDQSTSQPPTNDQKPINCTCDMADVTTWRSCPLHGTEVER